MGRAISIRMLPAERRPEASEIWRRLEAEAGEIPLAASWRWTGTWLHHYGDAVPHRFAVGIERGRECGIALLTETVRRRGPVRLRRLNLGTAGEPPGESVFVERNAVLALPALEDDFARTLLAAIDAGGGWHQLELGGFEVAKVAPFMSGRPVLHVTTSPAPRLALPAPGQGVEGILALLSSKMRKDTRRNLRKLGNVTGDWAGDTSEAVAIFEELCRLHEARWSRRGLPGAFAGRRMRGFHTELIETAPESVILFRVRNEEGTLACLYALVDRGDVLLYQSGVASTDDSAPYSPGLVAHVLLMAASADRGYRHYDLLAGEAPYKRRLTNGETELVWARASTLRGRLLAPRWLHAGV